MYDFAKNCWFLSGPTASGKTTIGIELAEMLNAEIISMDSMAIYRKMDVGTAKPSAEQRQRVPHYLIDILNPDELFSVSDFMEAAEQCAKEIRSRGREALFVGGTPLYLKSMLRGMFDGPPADHEFRKEVMEELERTGNEALHQRLAQVDPVSAAKLHPNDTRRIIRALEVYRSTRKPISHLQLQFDEPRPADECRVFVLDWPRPELHVRIEKRVDHMFENGFVEEVQNLKREFPSLGKTASQAVGYSEALAHLEGILDLERTIELTKIRTRQFAKRQDTWFRSLSECRSISREDSQTAADMAKRILELAEA